MAKFFICALAFYLFEFINASGYSKNDGGIGNSGSDLQSSINLPIFSHHKVNVHKIAGSVQRNDIPEIVISSGPVAMKLVFESQSTDLDVSHKHTNSDGNSQSSSSQDGEIVLKHSVTKPISHFVSEEIIPTRYLTQKVLPIKEYVKTIISKDSQNGDSTAEPSY